eukprot:g4480.t1
MKEKSPLKYGWREAKDEEGKTYYWNRNTRKTRWKRPTAPKSKQQKNALLGKFAPSSKDKLAWQRYERRSHKERIDMLALPKEHVNRNFFDIAKNKFSTYHVGETFGEEFQQIRKGLNLRDHFYNSENWVKRKYTVTTTEKGKELHSGTGRQAVERFEDIHKEARQVAEKHKVRESLYGKETMVQRTKSAKAHEATETNKKPVLGKFAPSLKEELAWQKNERSHKEWIDMLALPKKHVNRNFFDLAKNKFSTYHVGETFGEEFQQIRKGLNLRDHFYNSENWVKRNYTITTTEEGKELNSGTGRQAVEQFDLVHEIARRLAKEHGFFNESPPPPPPPPRRKKRRMRKKRKKKSQQGKVEK